MHEDCRTKAATNMAQFPRATDAPYDTGFLRPAAAPLAFAPGSGPAALPASVATAVQQLAESLHLLDQLVSTLGAQLAPVLREIPVSQPPWEPVQVQADTRLTCQIAELTHHGYALATGLHGLLERLGL